MCFIKLFSGRKIEQKMLYAIDFCGLINFGVTIYLETIFILNRLNVKFYRLKIRQKRAKFATLTITLTSDKP